MMRRSLIIIMQNSKFNNSYLLIYHYLSGFVVISEKIKKRGGDHY
jgi:hypothetical protein